MRYFAILNFMKYIKELFIILFISFIGEVLRYFIPLPIPASVYGLFIMLLCLITKIIKLDQVETTADFFLLAMPITLVPASVGILSAWDFVKSHAWAVVAIILISTVLVMGVTGSVSQLIIRKTEGKKK